MQAGELVLRDVHQPPAPSWWPPAPGWWLLAAALVAILLVLGWWWKRRQRKHRELEALFDRAVATAGSPAAEVAMMSELLRRAARRHDGGADRLHGEAWLEFLDREHDKRRRKRKAAPQRAFSEGPGRLLLEGGYRRDTGPQAVAELRVLARTRFLQWMR